MGKLFRAISAEHRKLWYKRSNSIYFAVVTILTLFVALYVWAVGSGSSVERMSIMNSRYAQSAFAVDSYSDTNWGVELSEDIEQWRGEITDLSVRLGELEGTRSHYTVSTEIRLLQKRVATAEYMLENNITPVSTKAYDSAIFCMWLMLPVVGFLALVASSDLFAGEFARGTITTVLPRPATRIKQYTAKIVTSILYSSLLMLTVFAVSMLACGLFIGGTNGTYVGYVNEKIYVTTLSAHCGEVFLCFIAALAVIVALCAALGNLTRSRTVSAALPFALMCVSLFFGDSLGAIGNLVLGSTLFSTLDLGAALCFVPNFSGISFTTCAISVGLHFLVFVICGYNFLKKDIT